MLKTFSVKNPRKKLAILGAGPKALALGTKAHTLRSLGFEVPEITIYEKNCVAGNWRPSSGLTNGKQPLGTSPDKDLGYPYASYGWGKEFNSAVNLGMQAFSWATFLIEQYRYSDWIDRGKPAPTHDKWAEYLNWAYDKISSEIQFENKKITRLEAKPSGWEIATEDGCSIEPYDGLVLTGPGKTRYPEWLPKSERILTVEQFWLNHSHFLSQKNARFAVVGSGETAACIAVALGQSPYELQADIISPVAMNYTRGESYVENHIYSDPFQGNWFQLTAEHRKDFISRTDRGVFSMATKIQLDQMENVELIPGRLVDVFQDSIEQLFAVIQYDRFQEKRSYDYIIIAIGFDPFHIIQELLSENSFQKVKEVLKGKDWNEENLELEIEQDLSVKNLNPKLHLPMLASFNQGPGYANLSSLGRLSDQILASYIPLEGLSSF